jgi:hypothetical protein
MKTNLSLFNKTKRRSTPLTALILGSALCLTTGVVPARDLGRGVGAPGPAVGVRPGVGVGAPGVGVRPGVGVGAPGVGVLPRGYYAVVPAGYRTVRYAGYSCRYVGGIYYRPATYQGQTVWIVVQ